jgi:signal transduction histidine kinase
MIAINENTMFEDELSLSKRIVERFIDSCSHDLKSPLCSIEGLIDIASVHSNTEEVRECHNMIKSCVLKMKRMLSSLEEYAQDMQRDLEKNDILADELVQNVIAEQCQEIYSTGVQVTFHTHQPVKWISDRHCNYIILKHIIKNAIRFSDRSKTTRMVQVNVSVAESIVEIHISDNGIGIPDDQQRKIFEPFHRGDAGRAGVGLGLFIVKGITAKLGGKCSVKSAIKVGTDIKILLPNNLF